MAERCVLITGCSSGFGRAMVPAFLDRGWSVIATLRDAPTRAAVLDEERATHPSALTVLSLDVTSAAERAAVAAVVARRPAGLDCLVNNAGAAAFGALEDLSAEQLRAQMEVNFFGPALLIRELLPALRRARGRVVNVSSLFGETGFPLTSAYCASKFALEGLSESLRQELAPHSVQVALVEPGRYRTRFGENAVWGERSFRPGSAYTAQTAAYARLKQGFASRPAGGPEAVARTVVALADSRSLPLRSRVGGDARLLHLLRRLLPERAASCLLGAAYARSLAEDGAPAITHHAARDAR